MSFRGGAVYAWVRHLVSAAARHFAFLVLSIPMDRALVCGDAARFSQAELKALADAGVDVFLAAYGTAR